MFGFFENSKWGNSPVELYLIKYGPNVNDRYAYTDFGKNFTFDGITYVPTPIQRPDIELTGTLDRKQLDIVVPYDLPLVRMIRQYPPSFVVTLIIYRGHFKDPDKDFRRLWTGRVLNTSTEGRQATLMCEPGITSLRRPGLRRNFQYGCPHVLYDPATCKANKANATVAATVTAINGNQITVNTPVAPAHLGGRFDWVRSDGLTEYRGILSASGNVVTIAGQPTALEVGATVQIAFGCNHTMNDCVSIHNNAANYGGQPWIPLKNPAGLSSPFI